ncbi:hypothetical protein KC19_4G212100 [Ceratodon purpureus]|uniref:Uncharacterized protein n=1 Tax=Ceratodon purpureus TaxID=3225 RepID=A0A8T0IEL7_CERPU|nr:hypothetical protein KC19_4G212100 [Ceratodon purpureus]
MQGIVEEPKVVVGLDFGTSFSGFAYALRAKPDEIYTFYDWPKQSEGGGLEYCKTQTCLLYGIESQETVNLLEWGWPAYVRYKSTQSTSVVEQEDYATPELDFEVVHDFDTPTGTPKPKASSVSGLHLLSRFKLLLTSNEAASTVPALPCTVTAKSATADFLSQIAKFILQELRNKFGPHISLEDVQWCLTVPAIWDDAAKQVMRDCAEMAGLVQGPLSSVNTGSPHALKLFTEPETASVYCQQFMTEGLLRQNSKFMVVDCGGGTVDLVVHEKLGAAPTLSLREVQPSSGDYCGGSRVDDAFFDFLRRKISCFTRFESEHPTILLAFLKVWERVKYRFDGTNGDEHLELPPKLAEMWESEGHLELRPNLFEAVEGEASESCDELKLTNADMASMFNPVITRVLELIEENMVPDLSVIMVVGGFSVSPYLMKRIQDAFGSRVPSIKRPPNPGSAVCHGAVTLGMRADIVVSRISKRTYGVRVARPFIAGVHSDYFKIERASGQYYCTNIFRVFVRKGDEVRFDDTVQNVYFPMRETQDELEIDLYSSDCKNVKYITDVGCKKEGHFSVKIPSEEELGFVPKVEISMFFGRSEIEVTAVGKNFDSEKRSKFPVKFQADGLY